jgi:hypothetical protein
MTTEEILDKYGVVFENFCPAPNAAIKITVDPNKMDIYDASEVMEALREIYPDRAIFTVLKGIDIK